MEYDAGGMEGNYRTTVQLISYSSPNFTNNVAIEDVISPNKWEFHNRFNPICGNPKIVIKNNGSATLTKATIHYWICGGSHEVYNWTGNLAFGETQEVELPITNQSFWDAASYCKQFSVQILDANGTTDEYYYDNGFRVEFESPPVYPANFFIWTKTNNAANENQLYVKDANGNTVFSRTNFSNGTTYKDTLNLDPGCYKIEFLDSGEDGLSFFANNDGNGYIRTRRVGGAQLDGFNANFGDKLIHYFTVGYGVSIGENTLSNIEVFPNPSNGLFNISIDGYGNNVELTVYDALGREIQNHYVNGTDYLVNTQINIENAEKGIYFIKISNGIKEEIRQLIKK